MNGEMDLQAKLSQILADPQAMQQVMSVAGALMGDVPAANSANPQAGSTNAAGSTNPPADSAGEAQEPQAREPQAREPQAREPQAREPQAREPQAPAPDLAALLGSLSAKPGNDPRCALLTALKPFLGDARRERADALIRAIRLAEIAGNFLK